MLYKIRTMYQDAEKATGAVWCTKKDSRVTPVGRVLRFLHLDELPQLFNVMKGDMRFVGPRPERPEFVNELVESIPGYARRSTVKPGITGLAQINLPPDETADCVQRKLSLDLEYIDTADLSLDSRIVLCTAIRMCGIRGLGPRMLRLCRTPPETEMATTESSATQPADSTPNRLAKDDAQSPVAQSAAVSQSVSVARSAKLPPAHDRNVPNRWNLLPRPAVRRPR